MEVPRPNLEQEVPPPNGPPLENFSMRVNKGTLPNPSANNQAKNADAPQFPPEANANDVKGKKHAPSCATKATTYETSSIEAQVSSPNPPQFFANDDWQLPRASALKENQNVAMNASMNGGQNAVLSRLNIFP